MSYVKYIIHEKCTKCNAQSAQSFACTFVHFFVDFPLDICSPMVYNGVVHKGAPLKGGVYVTIGQKLRKLRGKRTKQTVADAIGVSYSSYVKYERDERHPGDEVKKRIAKYFGVSVQSIFFG